MAFQGDSIFWVEVDKIVANPFQPRREFDESKLKELADSVRMYGILQPLTVTRKEISREDGTFFTEYELIAGERRLRASKLAGLAQVPVIIREGNDSEQEKLELAIIENLQREDLNAVDRALAFRQLADTFKLSHADVAKKVGRSREYVSNTMRLLQLPDYMLESLKVADISEGHGRTLLMLNDRPEEQDTVFREILLKKLSVREVERIARKIATDKIRKKVWKGTDANLIAIEKQFTESLGTRVQIAKTDYGGKISIDYFSEDDLATLLERLKDQAPSTAKVSETAVVAVTDEMGEINEAERDFIKRMEDSTPLENAPEPNQDAVVSEETAPAETTPAETETAVDSTTEPSVEVDGVAPPVTNSVAEASPEPEAQTEIAATESMPDPEVQTEVVSADPTPESDIPEPDAQTKMASTESAPTSAASSSDGQSNEAQTKNDHETEVLKHIAESTAPEKNNEDESDLYSMKNFTV